MTFPGECFATSTFLITFAYMKRICIVAGARPNFVKVAPLMRAIDNARKNGEDVECQLVYAGTADDPTLEPQLFDDLQMRRPDAFLGVPQNSSLNVTTGLVMGAFEQYLEQHAADVVVVVDDLASTMAAAIVTKKRGLLLAHLVAGTRSFDIRMPKEVNRLVIDGLSDYLFTAGAGSVSITTREGVEMSQVYMVGNILVDAIRFSHQRLRRPAMAEGLGLHEGQYVLFTLNRRALLADEANLGRMLRELQDSGLVVVAPLRGEAAAKVSGLTARSPRFHVVEPLSYLEFGWLSAHAQAVVTDSGNVAEEATFNGVPCITLNSYTEHIETVRLGTNELVGEDAGKLREALCRLRQGRWKQGSLPPQWDGRTAERIVSILLSERKN